MDLITIEISPIAFCVLSASFRTSSATTANPRPCSPARAASIAAFSASKLVCSAISLISVIIASISLARVESEVTASLEATAASSSVVAVDEIRSISLNASPERACISSRFPIIVAESSTTCTISTSMLPSPSTSFSFCNFATSHKSDSF